MPRDVSSYSNPVDHTVMDSDEIIVSTETKFHRDPVAPALEASRNEIGKCDHERGHVLRVVEHEGTTHIECAHCSAVWRDEGF